MPKPMAQPLIGAGGWGYFASGLEAYARGFPFVEVNASFYRRIPEPTVRRWRSLVPPEFVFSLMVNREVSHMNRLRASARARAAFAHDLRCARILRAPFVIVETPATLAFESEQVRGLENLAGMVPKETRLGLEVRAHKQGPLPAVLQRTMEDEGLLDVVDLSQTTPRVANEEAYSRLFGPGPHNVYEFDDDELRRIDRAGSENVRVALTFHGVRMYKDAARFLTFKRTGEFPSATSSRGVASLEEVLRPDARFPATREALVRDHGWKVIDIDNATRAHAATLLAALPDRTFSSLGEVVDGLGNAAILEAADASGPVRGGASPA
jgi:uncharacterized protein YecE (DUF72 family)